MHLGMKITAHITMYMYLYTLVVTVCLFIFNSAMVPQVLDPVCHQLFNFYRSGRPKLKRFTLEVVPVMVTAYLTAISRSDKKVRAW